MYEKCKEGYKHECAVIKMQNTFSYMPVYVLNIASAGQENIESADCLIDSLCYLNGAGQ